MTSFTTVQTAAMQRALRAAASPDAPPGPNPRVGCVILSPDGDVLAEGHHRGAGTAHAEVDALANLAAAGASARGTTAVVTLEPCNHQSRTGPCVQALLDAGVAEVIYAQDD
ncbi:deaminase, partial [Actinomyces oris]